MEAVGSILAKLVDIAIFRVCFFIAGDPTRWLPAVVTWLLGQNSGIKGVPKRPPQDEMN